ncbi:hypothetical protein FB567DRAFT_511753 [Paraphoma chrysanthemicola]|uniref:Uncharacterized protein n=1 Tax=Paraphoma chrysanthemicola TaxID=798071 RepID=A0A8K0RFF7_9PLEO|nr:hypothetical protein FB567DRAFT_511753 [Paraphoma chrysanthemicola]
MERSSRGRYIKECRKRLLDRTHRRQLLSANTEAQHLESILKIIMRFALLTTVFLTAISGALAGQNCKCQARNGQGPQNNAATEKCCNKDVNDACVFSWLPSFPGPNNQCSAGGTNCLNSGAFVECCRQETNGRLEAYCWN